MKSLAVLLTVAFLSACADYSMFENRAVCTLDGRGAMVVSRWSALGIASNLTSGDASYICERMATRGTGAPVAISKPETKPVPAVAAVPAASPVPTPLPAPISSVEFGPLPSLVPQLVAPGASAPSVTIRPSVPVVTPTGNVFPPLIIQPGARP
jgi:hypothetical protein